MPSRSNTALEKLAHSLLPQLRMEIGTTQDEIRRASERLGRVPEALLSSESKLALSKATVALSHADDQIVSCLKHLYKQYPTDRGEG
jgi:hypothetical protein